MRSTVLLAGGKEVLGLAEGAFHDELVGLVDLYGLAGRVRPKLEIAAV